MTVQKRNPRSAYGNKIAYNCNLPSRVYTSCNRIKCVIIIYFFQTQAPDPIYY